MSNEQHEKHFEKLPAPGEKPLAGKPILTGAENDTQQRLEKQTAARAHRFTKGDNVFKIELGDGKTVEDSRAQISDKQPPSQANERLLLAHTIYTGASLSGEISNDVDQVIAPGHSVKFTMGKGEGIHYEASGHWDAAQWHQQLKALNEYFTGHPEAANNLVSALRNHKGAIILNSGTENSGGREAKHSQQTTTPDASEKHTLNEKRKPGDHTPLSGEISNDLDSRVLPGHAIKFSVRRDGGVNWEPVGHWGADEWKTQLAELDHYFAPAHRDKINTLAAEIRENGGPITLGVETNEPKPVPPPRPPEGTDRNQWLTGSGYINGHPVQIGGPNDVKIPASAGANTPVVLSTMDGSGETIHGHIVANQNGQKFFYPDYSEDQQHRRYQIQNARQNMIQLTNAGVASY
jgi:hypothetical protein